MSGYINVTVVGNLGSDPAIRATQSGKQVANFSLAVDQGYGDKARVEWVNVVCFDKLAELASKYLKKGKTVALSGTLQTSSWEDKASGQKKYKTEVLARDLTFMDSGSKSGGSGGKAPATRQAASPQTRQAEVPQTRGQADPFDNSDDDPDAIPF